MTKPMTKPIPMDQIRHGFDGQPAEFIAFRDIEGSEARTIGLFRKIDRLEWLHSHKRIENHQFDAGRKLQSDIEQAQIVSYATLGAVPGGVGTDRLSDAKCDAIARVNHVRIALRGIPWRILELVVIDGLTVEKAETRMRMRYRAGHGALLAALDTLAALYGLA